LVLYVSTVNGVDLTVGEISDLKSKSFDYLSLTEQFSGLEIINVLYEAIDISIRVELEASANSDTVRKDMQIAMQKITDWRTWSFGDILEWEDLLLSAKQTTGVKRVLENYFFPKNDIQPLDFYLPRIRSFTLYDADGIIISDSVGVLTPTFFPNQEDFIIQQTLISSI